MAQAALAKPPARLCPGLQFVGSRHHLGMNTRLVGRRRAHWRRQPDAPAARHARRIAPGRSTPPGAPATPTHHRRESACPTRIAQVRQRRRRRIVTQPQPPLKASACATSSPPGNSTIASTGGAPGASNPSSNSAIQGRRPGLRHHHPSSHVPSRGPGGLRHVGSARTHAGEHHQRGQAARTLGGRTLDALGQRGTDQGRSSPLSAPAGTRRRQGRVSIHRAPG